MALDLLFDCHNIGVVAEIFPLDGADIEGLFERSLNLGGKSHVVGVVPLCTV